MNPWTLKFLLVASLCFASSEAFTSNGPSVLTASEVDRPIRLQCTSEKEVCLPSNYSRFQLPNKGQQTIVSIGKILFIKFGFSGNLFKQWFLERQRLLNYHYKIP